MKKLTSKIGKQFGGYALIKAALEFSSYVFARAAELSEKSEPAGGALFPNFEQNLSAAHPRLRTGGSVTFESSKTNPQDLDRRAYFEAGIVAYAKCFPR